MFRNICLTSLRHLFRNRIYSLTIILSLGTGFMVASLLIAFIVHEIKTDSFHRNRDRIFRIISDDPFDQGHRLSFIPKKFADYLSGNYPEVSASTMMYTINQRGLSDPLRNREVENLVVLAVDSAFLDIFDFPTARGSMKYPVRPDHILLTSETAEKLWNSPEIIGKMADLRTDTGKITFLISGIIDKTFQNSHLKFDALVFYGDFERLWGGINYVLLAPGTDPKALESKINKDGNTPGLLAEGQINYYLQDLNLVYFDENNTRSFSQARDETFIWISWTVIFLVLFLAGFNFLNLFFISFSRRWKEFGMKKVLGASPQVFRATAIIEVSIYLGFSLLLSFFLGYWMIPLFNDLLDTSLTLAYFSNNEIIMISAGLILVIALLVIFRITGYLYREKPVTLVNHQKKQKIKINRLMLNLQFIISVTLIIASVAMIRQMEYIREKPLGFNKNLFEIRLPGNLPGPEASVLKNRLSMIDGVERLTICSGNPISDNMIARYDLENGSYYTPYIFVGDEDYLATLGFELIAGNLPGIASTNGRLVNEAFLSRFNISTAGDAIGIKIPGTAEDYVTGVVRDFNIGSLKISIPPAIISFAEKPATLIARTDPEKISDILAEAEVIWKELYPANSFNYLWVDEEIIRKHQDDRIFSKIIMASSVISILISCFGIFAMSWGTSLDRSKEIGIRKVMGASSGGIFLLLLGYYLRRILVAFIIAIPVAWYLVRWWLRKFAYKIEISITLFLVAALLILIITAITISYQTIRSSLINPVKVLKHE